MTQNIVQDEPAYLIESRSYRESSLLITLFTLNFGRVRLIAKGARTGKRSIVQQLQQGVPLAIGWNGRGALKRLVGVESPDLLSHQISSLPSEYQYSLLYVNELIQCFIRDGQESPVLFAAYCNLISSFFSLAPLPSSLRTFEFTLLDELGYGIQLDVDCVTDYPVKSDQWYRLNGVEGVTSVGMHPASSDAISGQTLLNLSVRKFDEHTSRQARKITRALIDWHLDGKKLKSRELFMRMKELQNGG